MQRIAPTLCDSCRWLTRRVWTPDEPPPTCKAFPDGIPMEIYWKGADHRDPVDGDNGVAYEMDTGGEDKLLDWNIWNEGQA